jgi:MoaA/NifB/PqqE/SkfB family radical SAM enzyme
MKNKKNGLSSPVRNLVFMTKMFMFRKPVFFMRLWGRYFNVLVLRKTPLRFMDIAVGYECNMNCRHCSAKAMIRGGEKPLSVEQYRKIAKTLINEGCMVFHFTGGEPLLRKDIEEVIRAFKPKQCMISIQSNALLVTREKLVGLRKLGVDMFSVSIDSGIPEEHDDFRRTGGSYEIALNAIKLAVEIGFRCGISTCITHQNLRSEGLMKIIRQSEELGVWCFFNLAVPAGNWRGNTDSLLTPEDRVEMERIMAEHPCCRTDFESTYFSPGCSAIKEKLYMTPYGDVMPCPFIQISLGNVLQEQISAIRARALKVKVFKEYPQVCIAAEDREFIAKTPCYAKDTNILPVPYTEVDWMMAEIQSGN